MYMSCVWFTNSVHMYTQEAQQKQLECINYHILLQYPVVSTHRLNVCIDIVTQVRLGIIWNVPELPGESGSKRGQSGCGQESLIVVPVSNDVNGTGEDDHPGNGLVEGQVLVQ